MASHALFFAGTSHKENSTSNNLFMRDGSGALLLHSHSPHTAKKLNVSLLKETRCDARLLTKMNGQHICLGLSFLQTQSLMMA